MIEAAAAGAAKHQSPPSSSQMRRRSASSAAARGSSGLFLLSLFSTHSTAAFQSPQHAPSLALHDLFRRRTPFAGITASSSASSFSFASSSSPDENSSGSSNSNGDESSPQRKLTPLEMALMVDKPKGRYVNDGWVDDGEPKDLLVAPSASASSGSGASSSSGDDGLMSSQDHFADFQRISERTFADRFFAIDDPINGRYRDSGWVNEDEPIPLTEADFALEEKANQAGVSSPGPEEKKR